ncbi:Gfo/Idh/MocA family oxidoreductase [uncultured Campylobacter sp.]|uniref:Gfo/Idh/MocA family protein n=1 Tax=uncultured Campylobacter sp. TaxID=218934 RepID=UPI0026215806|nr:Gfo/Idh/MocA family oxidoreductase [uncultured Campylobacter sp.]
MKKDIAIIGLGQRGRNHLSELRRSDFFNLVGLYDKVSKQDFGRFVVYDDIEKMFKETKPEAVVITTPISTHKEMITRSMKYLKNIFVATPITGDLEQINELCEIAKENELNLAIGYSQRFNPTTQSIKKELEKNIEIYNISYIRGICQDEKESNLDSFFTQDIDIITHIFKSDVEKIELIREKNRAAVASLKMKNGLLVSYSLSTLYPKERCYMEICTDDGFYLADFVNFTLHKITKNGRINLRVDSEDFSIRFEHDAFKKLCDGLGWGNLASIEDVLAAKKIAS